MGCAWDVDDADGMMPTELHLSKTAFALFSLCNGLAPDAVQVGQGVQKEHDKHLMGASEGKCCIFWANDCHVKLWGLDDSMTDI